MDSMLLARPPLQALAPYVKKLWYLKLEMVSLGRRED
jgi:hypothetical protein